jgi:hypothetical protein
MYRINVEIDGTTHGDIYRMLRVIAENVGRGELEGESEYQTGFGDGPMLPYFYQVIELDEETGK